MKLTLRMYQEDDYWRIRDFLRQVFLLNDRRELSWHVARLDYWWCRRNEFAAALNPESKGQVFQQVHPGLRTPELEEEMLVLAEKHLAISVPNGKRKLWVWADEQDNLRQDILTRRGYTKVDKPDSKEYQRRRSLDEPILRWMSRSWRHNRRRVTRCAPRETLRNTPHEAGYRGKLSIPMSQMRTMEVGTGFSTSSVRRSTGVTWISWQSPRTASTELSAPSGTTT
jgi:hypothetical protein